MNPARPPQPPWQPARISLGADQKPGCLRHALPQPCPRCEEDRLRREEARLRREQARLRPEQAQQARPGQDSDSAGGAPRPPTTGLEEDLERFRFSIEQARSCLEVGRYREGERQIRKALDIMPASAEPYELLVEIYQEWGNPRAEAEALETLCRLAPTQGRLLRLARLQAPDRARDIYDRLLARAPGDLDLAAEAATDRLRVAPDLAGEALDILLGTGLEVDHVAALLEHVRAAPGLSGEAVAALDLAWAETLRQLSSDDLGASEPSGDLTAHLIADPDDAPAHPDGAPDADPTLRDIDPTLRADTLLNAPPDSAERTIYAADIPEHTLYAPPGDPPEITDARAAPPPRAPRPPALPPTRTTDPLAFEEELRREEERRRDEERSRQLADHRRQRDESRRLSHHTRRRLGVALVVALGLGAIAGGISLLPEPQPTWKRTVTGPARPGIPVRAAIAPSRQQAAIAYAPEPGSTGPASLDLVSLTDGQALHSIPLPAPPRQALFSPDGRYLIVQISARELLLIEGTSVRRIAPDCDVQSLRAEAERLHVVCLHPTPDAPRFELQVWRLPSMEPTQSVHLPEAYDYPAITAMGMVLREQRTTGTPSDRYSLWSPTTSREALAGGGDPSDALLISANGLSLLQIPAGGPPSLRRVMEQTVTTFNTLAMNPPFEADISGDGRLIALAAGRLIGLWPADQTTPAVRFDARMPVLALEMDEEGRALIALEQGGGWEAWAYR